MIAIFLAVIFAIWVWSGIRSVKAQNEKKAAALSAQIQRERREREKQAAQLEKEQENERREREAADAKLEKQILDLNKKVERAYFRIEKAEDEISRFGSLLDSLTAQKEIKEKELSGIRDKLSLMEDGLNFDPRTDAGNEIFDSNDYGTPEGAILFQERYAKVLEDGSKRKKDSGKEREKLEKRKVALENQIVSIDSKIFNAEQKIKTAMHNKYEAEMDRDFLESKLSA